MKLEIDSNDQIPSKTKKTRQVKKVYKIKSIKIHFPDKLLKIIIESER